MNNLLAPAMQLLRRPTTTSAFPPPLLRIKCSKPSGQLRSTSAAPHFRHRFASSATNHPKKSKLNALRKKLKLFQKRLDNAIEELQNAIDRQRKGLSGIRSPSGKVEKADRAEMVKETKAKVDFIEKKIQEITKQISEITDGAQ